MFFGINKVKEMFYLDDDTVKATCTDIIILGEDDAECVGRLRKMRFVFEYNRNGDYWRDSIDAQLSIRDVHYMLEHLVRVNQGYTWN